MFCDHNCQWAGLTPHLAGGSGHHVVEDVEGSLGVGLPDAARLLQQIWLVQEQQLMFSHNNHKQTFSFTKRYRCQWTPQPDIRSRQSWVWWTSPADDSRRLSSHPELPALVFSSLLTKREELSFLMVFAFPKASRMGFACRSCFSSSPCRPNKRLPRWRRRTRTRKQISDTYISQRSGLLLQEDSRQLTTISPEDRDVHPGYRRQSSGIGSSFIVDFKFPCCFW